MAGGAFRERRGRASLRVFLDRRNIEPHKFALITHRNHGCAAMAPHESQQSLFAEPTSRDVGTILFIHDDLVYFGNAVTMFFVPVS